MISHNLPLRLIFTPGKSIKSIFCSSRPYDKRKCFNNRCTICPRFDDESDCQVLGAVYKIHCNLCHEIYIGETSRTAHERLMEHCRFAASPDKYPDEALAKHYKQLHNGSNPDLTFSILCREISTVRRKIREAFDIVNEKPTINEKDECIVLERYLV